MSHDEETGFYRTEIDPGETRPFLALSGLLNTIEDGESTTLPVLYDLIDCEALNELVTWSDTKPRVESLDLTYTTDRLELVVEHAGESTTMRLRLRSQAEE